MSPSSTSSSRFTAWPTAALAAVAVLVVFDVAVARNDALWGYVERSNSGVVDGLERLVISKADHPKVLVMGSSRVRDGLSPVALEKAWGFERHEVLNLGITGGGPLDALALFERNADRFRDVQTVFFGLEWFHVDGGAPVRERVQRFQPLSTRWNDFSGETRDDLVLGYFWRSYGARAALRRWFKAQFVDPPPPLTLTADGRVRWSGSRRKRHSMRFYARKLFRRHKPSAVRARSLTRLKKYFSERQIQLVFFEVPCRPAFWPEVRRRYNDNLRAYRQLVKDALGPDVKVAQFDAAKRFGLSVDDFHDYGHMTTSGSQRYSAAFAKRYAATAMTATHR